MTSKKHCTTLINRGYHGSISSGGQVRNYFNSIITFILQVEGEPTTFNLRIESNTWCQAEQAAVVDTDTTVLLTMFDSTN